MLLFMMIIRILPDRSGTADADGSRKTMAIVNRLQDRALSVRGKSPTDGGKQALNLTDRRRAMLAQAKVAMSQATSINASRGTTPSSTGCRITGFKSIS